jgi:type VI secretion system protein ImpJ
MNHLRPVIWSKGTLLTPQHLQLQDRFVESLLNFHLDATTFCPWGFSKLDINTDKLREGFFEINQASGILPDGLLFSMPHPDERPRTLRIELDKLEQSTEIYLSIPAYREGGMNVSRGISEGGPTDRPLDATRYRSSVELVRDETSPTSERSVPLARKNFRFLRSDESKGSISLRVARVRRGTGPAKLELDPTHIPPIIDIESSPYLRRLVKGLIEVLSGTSGELGRRRGERNESLADFSAADIPNFWLLYTVNSYIPLLRHILESRRGHPAHLFDVMLSLAGSLTTFSPNVRVQNLPIYDHERLGECFTDLDANLRILLQTNIKVNFESLTLKTSGSFFYRTALTEDRYFKGTQMYLAMAADLPDAELVESAQRLLRISSGDRTQDLVGYSSGGLTLRHSPSPASIPVKLKYKYFALNQSGPEWDFIQRARSLAVYVPSKFPNPELELWIVLPNS